MKYFCSKCGKTTQYNFELPKFCAFCGQSFANKLSSPKIDDQRNKFLNELKLKKNINPLEIEEENTPILENNINFKKIKPSFQLDIYQNKGESFGSIIDNPSQPINFTNLEESQNTKTKEQILQEFQKEAGLSRKLE